MTLLSDDADEKLMVGEYGRLPDSLSKGQPGLQNAQVVLKVELMFQLSIILAYPFNLD